MSRELRNELEALQVRRRRLTSGERADEVTTPLRAEIATLQARRRELEVERFGSTKGLGAHPGGSRRRVTQPRWRVDLVLLLVRAVGFGLVLVGVGLFAEGHRSALAIFTSELWVIALVYSLCRPRGPRGS